MTLPRVALGPRDVRHEVGTRGPVRASVVAGDDAPRDAGQAAGQPIELADLGPYEVLPVRVRCTGNHAARLAVHGPHHGQVDRPDELAQPPPRASRSNRFGRHRRTAAARDTPRRRAALDQGGGHIEHCLVLIRVREVAHGHQRLVHNPRMPGPRLPSPRTEHTGRIPSRSPSSRGTTWCSTSRRRQRCPVNAASKRSHKHPQPPSGSLSPPGRSFIILWLSSSCQC